MTTINVSAAANAARQLAKQALDLQSLHTVLDRLAGDTAFLANVAAEVTAKQAEIAATDERLKAAHAAAANAEARAAVEFSDAMRAATARLSEVRQSAENAERRRDELLREVAVVEERLASVRAALQSAVAAVA